MIDLDIIGTLYEPVPPGTVQFDASGLELFEPTALPGWHVNATAPVPGWEAQRVVPSTPRRLFAGGQTEHYTFAAEAEFKGARKLVNFNPPPAPAVPQVVTMRQARLALLGVGKLTAVEAAINSLPEPSKSAARIEWDYSNEVQRHNGLVPMLGPALGLTTAQIDQLFIAAGGL